MSDTTPMSHRRVIAFRIAHDSYGLSIMRGAATYVAEESDWELARTQSVVGDSLREPVDGIIAQLQTREQAEAMRAQGLVVVNVSHMLEDYPYPRVGPDDEAIARLAADHLVERGYSTFSFFGIDAHWYSRQRSKAFVARLSEVGRGHEFQAPFNDATPTGISTMQHWLTNLKRPVGVMACNDLRARALADLCREVGLRVPEDVGIVGVDNDEWQPLMARLPLTSIDPAGHTIGYEAARMLGMIFRDQPLPRRHIMVPPRQVVVRRSTDVVLLEEPALQRACEWIRANTDRPVAIADVVEASGISRRALEMRAKQHMGRTLQDIIWQFHVDRAKAMLSSTHLPMKEVARRAGFGSQKQLNVVFRRCAGITPGAYRRGSGRPAW